MKRSLTEVKICKFCDRRFSVFKKYVKTSGQKYHGAKNSEYCSQKCAFRDAFKGIPPGSIGAIGELAVCADLLYRGWNVYRAVSPAASCDLIITNENRQLRVEVKCRSKRLLDKVAKIAVKKRHNQKQSRYDMKAVYFLRSRKIFYYPNLL